MSRLKRIWTMHSEQSSRLVDLALQHSSLAKRYGESDCTEKEKQEIRERIDAIREERETILEGIK